MINQRKLNLMDLAVIINYTHEELKQSLQLIINKNQKFFKQIKASLINENGKKSSVSTYEIDLYMIFEIFYLFDRIDRISHFNPNADPDDIDISVFREREETLFIYGKNYLDFTNYFNIKNIDKSEVSGIVDRHQLDHYQYNELNLEFIPHKKCQNLDYIKYLESIKEKNNNNNFFYLS